MKNNTVKIKTKSGRDYINYQVPVQSADTKKQKKHNEDAMEQAKYEAHCLL